MISFSAKVPNSVMVAQLLFLVNAAIWLISGVISLTRIENTSLQPVLALVIAAMMFGNAGAMLIAAIGIGKQNRSFFHLSIAFLTVNIVLTITDQLGALDFITLAIDLLLLILLIVTRAHYLKPR